MIGVIVEFSRIFKVHVSIKMRLLQEHFFAMICHDF